MHHLLCVCGKGSQLLGFTQDSTKSRKAPDNTFQDNGRGPWGQPAGQGGGPAGVAQARDENGY